VNPSDLSITNVRVHVMGGSMTESKTETIPIVYSGTPQGETNILLKPEDGSYGIHVDTPTESFDTEMSVRIKPWWCNYNTYRRSDRKQVVRNSTYVFDED